MTITVTHLDTPADTEHRVAEFNQRYPLDTPVQFWTGARTGPGRQGETCSTATIMCGAAAVRVDEYVTDRQVWVALSHIKVMTHPDPLDGMPACGNTGPHPGHVHTLRARNTRQFDTDTWCDGFTGPEADNGADCSYRDDPGHDHRDCLARFAGAHHA